ncbi:hypothetical protein EV426DRAFT_645461 [Tirmania nivea]|nr:hypothetical protein EV426DRAFT_645461 [Tirmania nivea]
MPRNSNLTAPHGHVLHSPSATSTTDGYANNPAITSPPPDAPGEKGRISPTFAQFAYLDGAVRKTRNRAYQKAVGNDGPAADLGEGPGSPEGHHGHGRSSTPARLHKRKARDSEGTRSHKKADHVPPVQAGKESEQSPAAATEEVDDEKHEDDDDNEDEYDGGTIAVVPHIIRAHAQRHNHHHDHYHPHHQQDDPLSPLPSQRPVSPRAPASDSETDSDPDPEILTARELSKQKTILYGYPISLLTSPTRNWMPILDKESLIYQGISEVMTTCGLPNAVPMLARRLSWIGKGKVVHTRAQRNRLGKFTKRGDRSGPGAGPAPPGPSITPSSKDRASNAGVEEWSLEKEQKRLLGGIIDLGIVVDGIDRARANSPIRHNIVGHPDEFVDVDVPLEVLLAGTESIAFTDLGFYRIYVPEKNQTFPLREQPNRPSRLNWDLEVSKVEAGGEKRGRQAPWSVMFLGYEWESVRMELLDAGDAEEEESREWATTMAGYRVIRAKEEVVSNTYPGGAGSGKLPGEGHVVVASHPWGRDVIEPPPVGVYAQGEYKDVVRNWFPWAWELVKDVCGDGEEEDEEGAGGGKGRKAVKRKAAVEAVKKVRHDIGGGAYGGVGGSAYAGGGGGKSGRGKTHGQAAGYTKDEGQGAERSPPRKRDVERVAKKARH